MVPGSAFAADTHPLHQLVARERTGFESRWSGPIVTRSGVLDPVPPPHPPFTVDGSSALDCVHAKHDIRLDPMTGETTATFDLEVRAGNNKPLSAIGFTFDEGLSVTAVSADGRSATFSDQVYSPSRVARIDLSPALAAGQSTTIHLAYSGTLSCGMLSTGGMVCRKGSSFSYFANQSVFPFLFDPDAPYANEYDGLTRDIVLRAPMGTDVVVTGEMVSDSIGTNGDHISTWTIDKPFSRSLGMYVLAGKLGLDMVPGRAVPTTLVYPLPEAQVDTHMTQWSPPVLDFVESSVGGPLPFQRSLSLVHLPAEVGDPGTATYGMTLLSDAYARAGDLMHEETWAHENSHLFWGIVVPEHDSLESRLMTEGMATLTELDYTFARHFSDEDRDVYLARRFVPIGLDLRTVGYELPPVQLGPGASQPADFRTQLYTLWAYYKTAATLDHLRVTLGEDVFTKGLRAYIDTCSYVSCSPDDFRTALEKVSGKDLGPFFSRWVTSSSRPQVTFSFEPGNTSAEIELTKEDDLPMTLEIWVRLESGALVKRLVELGPRVTSVHVDTPGKVRSVSASPRHDLLVDSRSSIEGDLDFDGETDGFDILKCARLVGKKYETQGAVGLWVVDEKFDPRCDLDGDLDIDDDDMDKLAQSFGSLRGAR